MLYLKEANLGDVQKEYTFVRDMPVDENGLINMWHGISYDEFKSKALVEMIDFAAGRNLPDGYVPETFYFLWDDDTIVGQFRIRHYLCESLRNGAGHIGYFVKREYRGRGYGKLGLRICLDIARKIVPEDEIYLRVNKENLASLRVMLRNGGRIHHMDEEKIYVRIKK